MKKSLNKTFYSKIAISNNINIVATTHTEEDTSNCGNIEVMDYKKVLTIKNMISQKIESYDIPDNFLLPHQSVYPAIAFNKQGTNIIVHGNDYSLCNNLSNPIQHHIIFPVTVNTPDQDTDNKKTLEKYFETHMICKNFKK
jgi:hypothetical protein